MKKKFFVLIVSLVLIVPAISKAGLLSHVLTGIVSGGVGYEAGKSSASHACDEVNKKLYEKIAEVEELKDEIVALKQKIAKLKKEQKKVAE